MADEPKPAKAAKKKRRRRKLHEEFVDYVVAVEDWGWSHSLSLDTDRRAVDPYHEFRHLQIRGRLLHPRGLKTDQVEITLLPSYDLLPEARKERQPRCVGSAEHLRQSHGRTGVNRRGVRTPIGGAKLLMYRALEGSLLEAYSQLW